MDLSIKEAARILSASERTVRNYVASGKLPAKRKGRQLFVPEEALQIFMGAGIATGRESPAVSAPAQNPLSADALEPIVQRLAVMEEKLDRIIRENQRLMLESQKKEHELADKNVQIEKLQRDMVYQKRLLEKELDDQQRSLEEKCAILQKENEQRLGLERRHFEEKMMLEEQRWSERLAFQEEQHAQRIVEVRNQEGFWSKLIKMMTWS